MPEQAEARRKNEFEGMQLACAPSNKMIRLPSSYYEQKEGYSPKTVGGNVIFGDAKARRATKEETERVQKAYDSFIAEATKKLKAKGWGKKEIKTEQDLKKFYSDAAFIVWTGFKRATTILLFDAMTSKPKQLDCDTSSLVFGDIFQNFSDAALKLVVVPGHAMLKVEFPDGNSFYVETTARAKRPVIHKSAESLNKWYGTILSEEPFCSESVLAFVIRGQALALFRHKESDPKLAAVLNLVDDMTQVNKRMAIQYFDEALRRNPSSAVALQNRATAYAQLGDYKQAVKDASRAIKLDKRYADAYISRAIAYLNMGEFDKALRDNTFALLTGRNWDPEFLMEMARLAAMIEMKERWNNLRKGGR